MQNVNGGAPLKTRDKEGTNDMKKQSPTTKIVCASELPEAVNGIITILGNLTIDAHDIEIAHSFVVLGNMTSTGCVVVRGDQTVHGSQIVHRYLTVHGNQTVCGDQTVDGGQTVRGDQTVHGSQTVHRYQTVRGNQTVCGDQIVHRYQTVYGGQTVHGNQTVDGEVYWGHASMPNIGGTSTVSGRILPLDWQRNHYVNRLTQLGIDVDISDPEICYDKIIEMLQPHIAGLLARKDLTDVERWMLESYVDA